MTIQTPARPGHDDAAAPPAAGARPAAAAGGSIWPGIGLSLLAAGLAAGVQRLVPALSPLLVAILLGALVGNLRPLPAVVEPGMRVSSKRLLRVGIVLLGLQLSLRDILGLGWGMILVVVAIVAGGILGTLAIGRALGIPPVQRLLIACGFSICGAAAVAALESATDAEDDDVASAIGLVVLYGTLMIGLAPLLLGALPLTERQQGLVAGGAIHEVAQVVAAGGIIGGTALTVAVIVKLARVLMLAPVIVAIGVRDRRAGKPTGARPPLVPLFVAGFLGACLLKTFVTLPAAALDAGRLLQVLLLSAAMFALGTGVRADVLRRVGGRPVVLGALSTGLVFVISLGGVLLVAG